MMSGRGAVDVETLERAVREAREASDLNAEAGALHKLGSVYLDASRFAEAVDLYQRQLQLVEGREVATAVVYSNLGQACFYSQRFRQARDAFER